MYLLAMNKLKPYHVIDCNYIDTIKQQVVEWCKANTDFFEKTSPRFDRFVNYKHLVKLCPALGKFIMDLKIPVKEIQFGVMTENRRMLTPLPLHVGEWPQDIKINLPICNTNNSVTEWFDVPEEVILSKPLYRREFYTEAEHAMPDLRELDPVVQDLYPKIGEYYMNNEAIVFNAYYPHRVRFFDIDSIVLPRIIMSIIPVKEDLLVPLLR